MSRRVLILIGLLFQTVAVFALFVPNAYHHAVGTVISLQTVPVDPMSIFRGEYVTLDYAVGQNIPQSQEWGAVVYVTLERGDDGLYQRVAFSKDMPVLQPGQVCLAGRDRGWGSIEFPAIAQYFVEQGLGKEIEGLQRMHYLVADISINGCSGLIKGLRLGAEAPEVVDPFGEDWATPPLR